MQRALRTAQLAGFPHPTVTELLGEFDYGEYEGLTTPEIQASRPGWELFQDGCPGGESPAQAYARAERFLELAASAGGNVLAFAHGHIIRTIAVAWLVVDVTVAARLRLDVASVSELAATDRGRELALWNSR
jgi:broad specificity phosphatase PhoE